MEFARRRASPAPAATSASPVGQAPNSEPSSSFQDKGAAEAITAHDAWKTTGLGCDGDSVAMTSATNPSLEGVVVVVEGSIPNEEINGDGQRAAVADLLARADAEGVAT